MTRTKIATRSVYELTNGAWTARWVDWVVELRYLSTGWRGTVWHWPVGARGRRLGQASCFQTPLLAARWAGTILGRVGVKVVVDGQTRPLSDCLAFSPAPVLEVQTDGSSPS